MIVWPVTSSSPITEKSRIVLTIGGQFHTTLSGVRKMKKIRIATWKRKHPRPGPRSASRSSPLYWTGPVVGRGRLGGVGSALGSNGGSDGASDDGAAGWSGTRRNDTAAPPVPPGGGPSSREGGARAASSPT